MENDYNWEDEYETYEDYLEAIEKSFGIKRDEN